MTDVEGIASIWKKEDWWAVWLGLGIVLVAIALSLAGRGLAPLAVSPPQDRTRAGRVATHFGKA